MEQPRSYMMEIAKAASPRRRVDRLSKLSDATLGRILSFLPTKEAARASALSSRWRNAFGRVDALSLEEPESPIPDYEHHGCGCPSCTYGVPEDPHPTPPFTSAVTAALLARHRTPAVLPPPLRSLRVVLDYYRREDPSTVDHWVSYALCHAARAPVGLELDLRLRRLPVCARRYSLRAADGTRKRSRSPDTVERKEEDWMSTRWPQYTVPARLFSCAALRSLSLGPCRLSPPASAWLPSLETLLLARVFDDEDSIQRLVDACPRLADLTLEACRTLTALYLEDNPRLRKLALRCCHRLTYVALDDGLHSLEYRGAVPDRHLLDFPRGGLSTIRSCKIDICGEEVSSAKELAKLGKFLQLFVSTKHLHLQSARLGCGVEYSAMAPSLPMFTRLIHLDLTGRVPHSDGDEAVAAVSTILRHAPNLEVLSLFLDTGPGHEELKARDCWQDCKEGELKMSHKLGYNEHEVIPSAPAASIPCLRNQVREINLVHYHGGSAQRMLAKFLLRNSPVLDRLYCGFPPGTLSIQEELRDEIRGWARNKPQNIIFD